jgi:hypothetical protein
VTRLQARPRRITALGVLVGLAMTVLGSYAVAHAAGGATFADGAHLFASRGRADIQRAARDANMRVLVLTTAHDFSSRVAWHRYVRSQSTDRGGITIGLLPARRDVYVLVGPDAGLSPAQASQGIARGRPSFGTGHFTAGVIRMIQYYQSIGAASPRG